MLLDKPEVHIVGQVLVPDLAGWRRERLPKLPDAPFLDLAPDWICEVLSPSTIALDRTRKIHQYARAGVTHLWFIAPSPETLEVFSLETGRWRLIEGVAGPVKVQAEPFHGVEVNLANLCGTPEEEHAHPPPEGKWRPPIPRGLAHGELQSALRSRPAAPLPSVGWSRPFDTGSARRQSGKGRRTMQH